MSGKPGLSMPGADPPAIEYKDTAIAAGVATLAAPKVEPVSKG